MATPDMMNQQLQDRFLFLKTDGALELLPVDLLIKPALSSVVFSGVENSEEREFLQHLLHVVEGIHLLGCFDFDE